MSESVIYVPTERYVGFDEAGEITSVSNSKPEGLYLVLELNEVINFLTGKETTSSYVVIYDTLEKKNVLKAKYYADETSYSIVDDIFNVPHKIDKKPDLVITQNIQQKQWQFTVDPGLLTYLQSQAFAYERKLQFSITRKNDPHELYQLIIINFNDLVKNGNLNIPFKYESEENNNNVSVYTTKRFETYVYEVIND